MSRDMSRTGRFLLNTAVTSIFQIALLISGFIVPRIMLTYYGSEVNGLVSSITQFVNYLALVEAGLSGATIFALYKPLAEGDFASVSGVVSASRKFYIRTGWLFTGMMLVLAIAYPLYVHTQRLSSVETGLLIMALGAYSSLEMFTLAKYRTLLSADQRTYVISLASLAYLALNVSIVYALARVVCSVLMVRAFAVCGVFARSAVLSAYVKRRYRFVNFKAKPDFKALEKRWDALYLQILGVVQKGAPTVILTLICRDLRMVSVFSVFQMILQGLQGIVDIFLSGLSAGFGDVIARGEKRTLQRSYARFEVCFYMLITVLYAAAFATIMPFVRIFTSGVADANYNAPAVGALCVLNGFLYSLKVPQSMMFIAAGMYRDTRVQTTIQALIIVALGGVLGRFWGIVGVLIGSIAGNLYRDVDLLFFVPRRITGLPVRKTFFRWLYMSASFVIIILGAGQMDLAASGYLMWAMKALGVTAFAVSVTAAVTLVFDREDIAGTTRMAVSLVKRWL